MNRKSLVLLFSSIVILVIVAHSENNSVDIVRTIILSLSGSIFIPELGF